jgi:dihydroorotase
VNGLKNWYLPNGLIYKNGSLLQQALLIIDGKISAFGVQADKGYRIVADEVQVFDAKDCVISRGFIDLHVHLREPGGETKETIATGSKAAARGGFTSVYAMPNTNPALDSLELLHSFQKLTEKASVRVHPVACLSKQRQGEEVVDYESLAKAGVKLFSDDGDAATEEIIVESMTELAKSNSVFINHLEDKSMTEGGQFHDDIPPESEYLMLARDLKIVAQTGCHYHAAHLSCAQSVELIRQAKSNGLPVTAEVTPHHLLLTYEDIKGPIGNYMMKPPLRTSLDRNALIDGLADGTIDCIATDHAPHGNEKDGELSPQSPFGVTGLETAFAALYTGLVLTRRLSLLRLLEALTVSPAKICNEQEHLAIGEPADIVVINLKKQDAIKKDEFFSKGTNSPFINQKFTGWPVLTLVAGEERYNGIK